METLTLFRRHGRACEAGRLIDEYTTEVEERRKSFKHCDCRIYARGTLAGRYKNFPTRQRDWALAREVVAPFLARGSWEAADPQPPPPSSAPDVPSPGKQNDKQTPAGHAIVGEVEACVRRHQNLKDRPATIRSYRTVLKQFRQFADQLGLRYVEEWKPEHTRQLQEHWGAPKENGGRGNRAGAVEKKLGYVKCFFQPFVDDDTLRRNPARIRLHQNQEYKESREPRQKSPLSDAQLTQLLDACRNLDRLQTRRGTTRGNVVHIGKRDHRYRVSGQEMADFMQLSWRTGLRISDVTMFHADRLQTDGTVKLRAKKNGKWVCVPIPEYLQQMIHRRAAAHGPIIFGPHGSEIPEVNAKKWQDRLKRFAKKAGVEKLTHHRFRHTFVRILLEDNVPVSVVADLIGDTERTVRMHYSDWVTERQESANRAVRQAFANSPRTHAI